MLNYLSIGLDGDVSLAFHHLRRLRPYLCLSSLVNKAWYGILGTQIFLSGKRRVLSRDGALTLLIDGKEVRIPPGVQGLVVLSVGSYAGGSRIWPQRGDSAISYITSILCGGNEGLPKENRVEASASDGVLEVRGLKRIYIIILFLLYSCVYYCVCA